MTIRETALPNSPHFSTRRFANAISGGIKPFDLNARVLANTALSAFSFKIHSVSAAGRSQFWLLTPEFCFDKT